MKKSMPLDILVAPVMANRTWAQDCLYVSPDNFVNTDFFVYFDFLRGITREKESTVFEKDWVGNAGGLLDKWLDGFRKYVMILASSNQYRNVDRLVQLDSRSKQNLINCAINGFITSISVNHQRSGASTASINLTPHIFRTNSTQPKTYNDPIFFKILEREPEIFQQLFCPHTYVYIYAPGRVIDNAYFPIFHGLINEIENKNDKGMQSVSIECEDVSKYLRLVQANLSPAIYDLKIPDQMKSNLYNFTGDQFFDQTADFIVAKMICGTDPVVVSSPDEVQSARNSIGKYEKDKSGGFGIIDYLWAKSPGPFFDELIKSAMTYGDLMSFPLDKMRGKRLLNTWGVTTSPYRQLKSPVLPVWDTGIELRSDICKSIKAKLYGEFYADVMGNFNLHPMRLGASFLSCLMVDNGIKYSDVVSKNGIYVLDEDELITTSRSFNDDGIVTHLGFSGTYRLWGAQAGDAPPPQIGVSAPMEMKKKFGLRYQTHTEELVNDEKLLKLAGYAHLNLMNADLYNCAAIIPLRPEIQIARPVLLLDRGEIFYINSISHNITIGAVPTTNLGLTFGRSARAPEFDFIAWLIEQNQMSPYDIDETVKKLEQFAPKMFETGG